LFVIIFSFDRRKLKGNVMEYSITRREFLVKSKKRKKMNNLVRIINALDYKELKAIQKDLAEGNLGKLIAQRIKNIEVSAGNDANVCPTCGINIKEESAKFILIFGPPDFRKKASFCGHDCLSFFIQKVKPLKH